MDEVLFDDFKPVSAKDEVNYAVKKVVERELSELESFKADNDEMLLSYDEPKMALTEMMVEYIQNVGDVNEVNICSYNSGNGEAIDAWGYSGDDEFISIDLFLTVYVDPEKSNSLPASEIERHFKWMEKFFERSRSGSMFPRIRQKQSDLYQIAQLINDSVHVDRVRLFLLTNAITPSNYEKDLAETDEGTMMEYNLWDVKRIKKHDDILRGKEAVVVDFEDQGFSPLPCLRMPNVSDRVDCYLTIIPGEALTKIYNEYHQHILEQNVRTFLQFKGSSNKGIRDTLIGHTPTALQIKKGDKPRAAEPDMFFSYNNGISTTATSIEVKETEQGLVITKLTDWQIVNGGQTTASISAVVKMKDTDPDMIKQVFVAMKVSVIKDIDKKDDLVPLISKYANTQSAIKKSDFGINEPFLQQLEQQSRMVWVKNAQNKEISKWFFERTRGQYMDKAKHTANAKEEREYYAEYPKEQMFDKTTLAKVLLAWNQDPVTVCKGGENSYVAFMKKAITEKISFDEQSFKKTVAKIILFKAIDSYYGKDGVKLVGYKSQMIAYTLSTLASITGKKLDLLRIWDEQGFISSSLYNDLSANVIPIYVKVVSGATNITYKVKVTDTTSSGRKVNKWEIRTISSSDIDRIKSTCLYETLCLVRDLHKYIWNHLLDVDEGTDISTNSKKVTCWTSLCAKHIDNNVTIPADILTSEEEFELTPSMIQTQDMANSYDYETWHDINQWGKDTGLISPRDAAFMGGIYFWCKRGNELTYKQARYAMKVLEKARAAGWEE